MPILPDWPKKLGERYEISRTNIKKWPVGSPIQAALDALEILRKQRPFHSNEVQQVSVQLATDEAAIVKQPRDPGHLLAAHGRGDGDGQDGYLQFGT